METLGLIIGAILTLLIFSYLLKDTFLYRWALALLVGCGIGYGLGLAWHYILREWISHTLVVSQLGSSFSLLTPLILGALLLFKGFSPNKALGRLAGLGNIPLALLVGVGTATAVSGALIGTLIPQIIATGDTVSLENGGLAFAQGLIIVIGTIASLLVFSSSVMRQVKNGEGNPVLKWITRIGQGFIVIALGFTFSSAVTSALTVLIMRLWKLTELFSQLFSFGGG
ncbi:MAG: hypothetical protein E4H27_02235 [Anaerolineales bacterium]|nr:MAG: hypothetical protein E4H27_02235 [Anaerolineales bacterium]